MGLIAETRSHATGEEQLAILVGSNQQRSKAAHPGCAFSPPADHRLLAAHAFEFQPAIRAAVLVLRIAILGDDAFQTLRTDFFKIFDAIAFTMFCVANRIFIIDHSLKNFLAFYKWKF